MFEDLKRRLLSGEISFTQALPEALPQLRGKITDDNLLWLSSELQGYADALTFYQSPNHGLPAYRAVPGALYLMRQDGSFEPLNHPYAARDRFFLSAPIHWLEEFSNLQGDDSLVELQEFGAFVAKMGGGVVCSCPKSELKRIIATFRNEFIKLLDQVDAAAKQG